MIPASPKYAHSGVMRLRCGFFMPSSSKTTRSRTRPSISPNPGMFNETLRRCERLAKHDCLVCIISDGSGHDEESRRILTRIAQHNDVLFAFVHDPLEAELPEAGKLVFGDSVRQVEVDTGSRKLRDGFREGFARQRAEGRKFLLHRETPVIPLSTTESVGDQLNRLLGSRLK